MPSETGAEFIALQEALAGRYSLQRELGRGGMGIVYLAHEVALDRPGRRRPHPCARSHGPWPTRTRTAWSTASGSAVDERSDIYSLGVVGYYMLSGRLPFDGDGAAAILAKHITQPAPPVAAVAPELPRHLAQAVDRCLAKDPAERFANGEDLAAALGTSLALRREIPLPQAAAGAQG